MCTFHCGAEVVLGRDESGEELRDVMVARAGQHAEAPEELEPHAVVVDHVALVPPLAGRDLLVLHRRAVHHRLRAPIGIVEWQARGVWRRRAFHRRATR